MRRVPSLVAAVWTSAFCILGCGCFPYAHSHQLPLGKVKFTDAVTQSEVPAALLVPLLARDSGRFGPEGSILHGSDYSGPQHFVGKPFIQKSGQNLALEFVTTGMTSVPLVPIGGAGTETNKRGFAVLAPGYVPSFLSEQKLQKPPPNAAVQFKLTPSVEANRRWEKLRQAMRSGKLSSANEEDWRVAFPSSDILRVDVSYRKDQWDIMDDFMKTSEQFSGPGKSN